jgi:glycosyltransferase involved in cell wall biosynthesis
LLPVTAVVCARNRARSIAECIAAIQGARPTRILVVDGLSTDGTAEAARAAGADVVSDGGRGLGAARDLGAHESATEWVAYVDSDTIVSPDTLEVLLDVATSKGYDAVQAQLRSATANPSYWQREEIWRRHLQERPGPAQVVGCQATLVRRSLLAAVAFDPVFRGAAEDHDWCFRAGAAGARLAHTDATYALHEDRRSLGEFTRQRLWYGRGMARLLLRHRRVAPQVRTASAGIWRSPRHLPFMLVSWSVTAAGMAAELLSLTILRRDVLRRLRSS